MDMFSSLAESGIELSYTKEMNPQLIQSQQQFEELIHQAMKWPIVSYDCETSGLSYLHADIVGFSLHSLNQPAFYTPLRHKLAANLDPTVVIPILYELLKLRPTIAHHFKFDFNFLFMALEKLGIDNPDFNVTHDTMLMSQVLNPGRNEKHELKLLMKQYFGIEMPSFKQVTGGDSNDFSFVSLEDAVLYGNSDSFAVSKLFEYFKPILANKNLVYTYKLEMACVKAFAEMERVGVPVDMERITEVLDKAKPYMESLSKTIYQLAGEEFNIDSPSELSKIIFDKLQLDPPSTKNQDGAYSTAAEILEERSHYDIIAKVIEYREVAKMISAFLTKGKSVICEDGRLHTSFNQLGTRSGRASSSGGVGPKGSNPKLNMHQLPNTSEKFNFRSLLVPPTDYYWLAADYVQIEYALMACVSGETDSIEQLKLGVDFHKLTASFLFGVSIDKVTRELRFKGKTLNFGICFGMSHYSLARILKIHPSKAKELVDLYFSKLQNLLRYIEAVKKNAYQTCEVRTAFGRYRDFSALRTIQDKSTIEGLLRATFNTVIQGSAADINKMGVAAVYNAKAKYGKKILMCLNVHDELSLFVHNSIPLEEAIDVIRCMEQDFTSKGWIKFKTDVKFGKSYGELKSVIQTAEVEIEIIDDAIDLPSINTELTFIDAILIQTGEYADFNAIKLACSPARAYSYRVILQTPTRIYLLPSTYSFNPTQRMMDSLKTIPGVQKVDVLHTI